MFLEYLSIAFSVILAGVLFAALFGGIKVVPQSQVYVIERFGKYTKTLGAGLNFIIPFLDRVAHKTSILERQLDDFEISVITSDNVEVRLKTTVFFRVTDAARSVYRIDDVAHALHTAATSIVRSAAGRLDLDSLQSSRDSMNQEIATNLHNAAEVWGIEVTRTEVIDIIVDEITKEAQRQQLNAERQKRAAVAGAEGDKRSQELAADAQLYEAEKQAEAVRITADAEAYAIKAKAEADAEQIRLVSVAIQQGGEGAVNFELAKRQVEGLSSLGASDQTKTLVIPTDITKAFGSVEALISMLSNRNGESK